MSRPGTVKWFSDHKGYGFIEQSSGPDIYVHHADIEMKGYKTLRRGMQVDFEVEESSVGLTARKVNPRD